MDVAQHRDSADDEGPDHGVAARNPGQRRDRAAREMVRNGQKRGQRSPGCVRLTVESDLAEELPARQFLRDGHIARVHEAFDLVVGGVFVRQAKRVAGRCERVEALEDKEQPPRGAGCTMCAARELTRSLVAVIIREP